MTRQHVAKAQTRVRRASESALTPFGLSRSVRREITRRTAEAFRALLWRELIIRAGMATREAASALQ